MDDALGVRRLEALGNLHEERQRLLEWDGTTLAMLAWLSAASIRASRSNRASRSGSAASNPL